MTIFIIALFSHISRSLQLNSFVDCFPPDSIRFFLLQGLCGINPSHEKSIHTDMAITQIRKQTTRQPLPEIPSAWIGIPRSEKHPAHMFFFCLVWLCVWFRCKGFQSWLEGLDRSTGGFRICVGFGKFAMSVSLLFSRLDLIPRNPWSRKKSYLATFGTFAS